MRPRPILPATVPRTRPARPVARLAPQHVALSAVVVNYCQWGNTARLARQLLSSEIADSGTAEVVVVDNHSPSHKAVPRLRRTLGVSVRRFGRNFGFARAVNEGARLGRGEWLLVLNPDMSVPPNFLDDVHRAIERADVSAEKIGVIGFKLEHSDGSPQHSCGEFPTLAGTLRGLFLPRAERKCHAVDADGPTAVPWLTGCCLLVRRDCLEEVGGMDEEFFLYYEDVDFCRRAGVAGWRVEFDPSVTLTHHAPLHKRKVTPALRLMTRHGLLTYACKHWSPAERGVLAVIVWAEAWARQFWALFRGDRAAAGVFGRLRRVVADRLGDRHERVAVHLKAVSGQLRKPAMAGDK